MARAAGPSRFRRKLATGELRIRKFSAMRAFLLGLVVAAVACTQPTPQQQAAEIAGDLCACYQPGDANCVASVEQGLGTAPSQACIDCVLADQHACAAMLQECVPACIQVVVTGGM